MKNRIVVIAGTTTGLDCARLLAEQMDAQVVVTGEPAKQEISRLDLIHFAKDKHLEEIEPRRRKKGKFKKDWQ